MRLGARTTVVALVGAVLVAATAVVASSAGASTPPTSTITLQVAKSYQPKAQPGTTDDYHCTVMDPHVTQNAYVT